MATNDTLRGFDALPDSAYVPDTVIAELTRTCRQTVWRWSQEGRIPKPVKLGRNLTRWQVGPLRASLAKLGV